MSAIESEVPWSRGRWWGMVLTIAAVQVLLVFFLGERTPIVPRRAGLDSSFTLASNLSPGSPIGDLLAIADPTLFALPDPRNFSGRAWLLPRPLVQPSFTWTEPERWLTQSVAELGSTVDALGKKNRLRYRTFDEKPPPAVSRVDAPAVPLPTRSTVRVEGSGNRAWVALPDVPSVRHTDVLADTVVQAGIAPSGFTLSAIVLSGSGSESADRLALDAVRSARFEPLAVHDPFALTWGVFTFRWHVIMEPVTNAIPAGASP